MSYLEDMKRLRASVPKQPGENELLYQNRLGSILTQERAKLQQQGPFREGLFSQEPQAPNEPNWYNGTRNFLGSTARGVGNAAEAFRGAIDKPALAARDAVNAVPQMIGQLFASAVDTPQQVTARAAAMPKPAQAARQPQQAFAAGGGNMNSYQDPRWGGFEAAAEKKYGLPAGLLASIRTKGERSNGDQVSGAGARGVYQFIPSTRDAVLKKYGVDAYGSPEQQAMATAALLKENIGRAGGDVRSGVQQYHGGLNPKNYGPQNAAYLDRVFGEGAGSAFSNPFDPSYYNQAQGQLDRAGELAKKPTVFNYTPEASPEMPDVREFLPPPTDFSKVDKAVEALRPAEVTEATKLQMRRTEYFRGIGQALAQLPESAGIGKILAAVGGMAMAGTAAGDDKVKAEMDRFDAKMAQFNVAVLNNESRQADVRHNEAAQQAQMLYGAGMKKWEQQYGEWAKYNQAGIDAKGNISISSRDPKTGMVTMKMVPNAAAIDAATAGAKAQLFTQMGGEANAGNRLVATAQNGLIAQTMVAQVQQGQAQGEDMLAMPAFVGAAVIDSGQLEQLFSTPEVYAGVQAKAAEQALAMLGQTKPADGKANLFTQEADAKFKTSPAYQDAYRKALVGMIQQEAITNPTFRKRLFDVGGSATATQRGLAQGNRRETSRTGPKGTTRSTTTDYGE